MLYKQCLSPWSNIVIYSCPPPPFLSDIRTIVDMSVLVHWDLFNWVVCIQPIGEVAMVIIGLIELLLVTVIELMVTIHMYLPDNHLCRYLR
jgi:hypothetical protein